jgi:hypothetical protein
MPKNSKEGTKKEKPKMERFTIAIPREYIDILWKIGMHFEKRKSGYIMAQEIVKLKCGEIEKALAKGKDIDSFVNEFKTLLGEGT